MAIIPVLEEWKQGNQDSKINPGYTAGTRPGEERSEGTQ